MSVAGLWLLLGGLGLGGAAAAPAGPACEPLATAKNRRFASAELLLRTQLPLPDCLRLCCSTPGCSGLTYTGFITSAQPFCDLLHCRADCDTVPADDASGLISVLLRPAPDSLRNRSLPPSSDPPSEAPVTTPTTTLFSSSPLLDAALNESGVEVDRAGEVGEVGESGEAGLRQACVPYSVVGILALLVLVCGVLNCALLAAAAVGRRHRSRAKPQPPPSAPVFSTHLRAYDNLHLDVDSHPPLPSSALPSPASGNGGFRNISTLS